MPLDFTTVHMDTLVDLYEIAKKHDCAIRISIRDNQNEAAWNTGDECLNQMLDYFVEKKEITILEKEAITGTFTALEGYAFHDSVWFELVEKLQDGDYKHHYMAYHQYSFGANVERDKIGWFDSDAPCLREKTEEWIRNTLTDEYIDKDEQYWSYETTDTVVRGFDGVSTYINVYREGMALKFFGDLVCDYLGEPRIIRTY